MLAHRDAASLRTTIALPMLRLIGIVVSIGLADSFNPTTLAPALVLAAGERGRRHVGSFTAGVFSVYFLGGVLIALGPGELVLNLAPRPSPGVGHVLEAIAGVLLLLAAWFLWHKRAVLAERQLLSPTPSSKPRWLLGAGITAFELPTAFPYFGAIAAVVGSNQPIPREIALLALYNACFVAPMIVIWATLTFAGERAQARLASARGVMQRHWPLVLAMVALIAGSLVIALGVTGLLSVMHNDTGTLARKLHSLLPH